MAGLTEWGNKLYTGERSVPVIARRKLWYLIAAIAILVAATVPWLRGGFVLGIDFTGGSQFTVEQVTAGEGGIDQSVATDAVLSVAPEAGPRVAVLGDSAVRVQTEQLTDDVSAQVSGALAEAYDVPRDSVSSSFIGASWGQDITLSALRGLGIFLVVATVFMAIYFRTWKMSIAAMASLVHDLILTVGVYGVLGFEITPAAVIGFLTILGYSLYDTVVVFDKIRENTTEDDGDQRNRTFAESVNLAVNQTLVRSINTAVVGALPVAAILVVGAFVLGAETLIDIALSLFVGTLVGTYSTIFIAAPTYTLLREKDEDVVKQTARILESRAAAA
ncbi:protein translocase subunit SecF [Arenivirga flava]|uniref:protein translocase subunit SecF n=1 Tax=Arenivirga flava TaxID=1930060 RepID=UPI0032AFBAA5